MRPNSNPFSTLHSQFTILLVEDNPEIQKVNKRMLELYGYTVAVAFDIEQAWRCMEEAPPDLLVLDIMLPDGSGLAFCEQVREKSDTPILFLTALGEKDDIVGGLRKGGDDYLAKPYDYDVLLARIEALLRRAGRRAPPAEDIGPLRLEYRAGRAYVNGGDALLKPKEFALLRVLVEDTGRFIPSEKLYETVWGAQPNGDPRTVYVHIAGLRKKLCMDDGSKVNIEHVRGKGYRFVME